MRDVQTILGHAHLSTTADVYLVEDEAQVIRRVRRHLIEREQRTGNPPRPWSPSATTPATCPSCSEEPRNDHDDRCTRDPPHPGPVRRR
jgi:hypothetical protein